MENKDGILPLIAAGGVVCQTDSNPLKVLLMKRNGFWDIPKGKLEKGESIEECAIREVEEETGIRALKIHQFLCETYHEFEFDGERFGKTTHWYSMESGHSNHQFKPQEKEGITEIKWEELEIAKEIVEFENLVVVLNRFEQSI